MQAALTIIRYPKIFVPVAFFAMALHRLPLWFNKNISFYKLMGCGRNGTFDKKPDLQQWAILTVMPSFYGAMPGKNILSNLYGRFISGWLHFFNCETFTILLVPTTGHGYWDGKKVFGELDAPARQTGVIATLTRATIRMTRLRHFWKHVAPVADKMSTAKGYITSIGIGEIPWVKQATFSVWENTEDMKAFAYGMREHTEVIKKTRQQQWYSEEMFVRFSITGSFGTLKGTNPLAAFNL